jgi:hypothetical protein
MSRSTRTLLVVVVSLAGHGILSAQTVPEIPATADRPVLRLVLPSLPRLSFPGGLPSPFASHVELEDLLAQAAAVRPERPGRPERSARPTVERSVKLVSYEQARALIDAEQYHLAIDQFNRLIQQFHGNSQAMAHKVDAAHYWKAYSQLKVQELADSLETLQELQKKFGEKSRWTKDARALEVEVRHRAGQSVSPDTQSDEDLRLLVLQGLMQTQPEQAFPRIEQLLVGNSSVRVKENALFVVSQSRSPRALNIITNVAKDGSNPDLQLRSIRYLGVMRGDDNAQLLDSIYRGSNDATLRRAIIRAFGSPSAASAKVMTFTTRRDADNVTWNERLVFQRAPYGPANARTGEALRGLYTFETETELRREIISRLASQRNDTTMRSKDATDYMLELLK